jgi:hypothetical protein
MLLKIDIIDIIRILSNPLYRTFAINSDQICYYYNFIFLFYILMISIKS